MPTGELYHDGMVVARINTAECLDISAPIKVELNLNEGIICFSCMTGRRPIRLVHTDKGLSLTESFVFKY